MNKKLTVFVDSNYFISKFLDLRELRRLKEQAQKARHSLQFCTTNIVKSETLKNIGKQVREIKKHNGFITLCVGHNDLDQFLTSKWEEKIKELDFICIEELEVLQFCDYQEVIHRYNKKSPPFSTKKPEEFKDAFVLLTIERFIQLQQLNLVGFISGDSDWGSYLESKPNYIVGLYKIQQYLQEKETNIHDEEFLEAQRKHKLKEWRKKRADELRVKLIDEIEYYVDKANDSFTKFIVREIKNHYDDTTNLYNLLNPLEFAIGGEVDFDSEEPHVDIGEVTITNQPSLNLEETDDDLESEGIDDLSEVNLNGSLNCRVDFTLYFKFSYSDFETAIRDEGEWYPLDTVGSEGILEGIALIQFDSDVLIFSSKEDFEIQDNATPTFFKIIQENLSNF